MSYKRVIYEYLRTLYHCVAQTHACTPNDAGVKLATHLPFFVLCRQTIHPDKMGLKISPVTRLLHISRLFVATSRLEAFSGVHCSTSRPICAILAQALVQVTLKMMLCNWFQRVSSKNCLSPPHTSRDFSPTNKKNRLAHRVLYDFHTGVTKKLARTIFRSSRTELTPSHFPYES